MNASVKQSDRENWAALLAEVADSRNIEAFEQIFRSFGPRVRSYMMRQVRDAQLAEELMQETMVIVWNKASLFDAGRGTAESWIFTIARNLRISAYRKTRRPEVDLNDPALVPDDEPPPGEEIERRQDAERLHRALQALPAEQLEMLRHSFFDETPHRAIAEKLGLPLGTVKSRIRMAFSKLRAALEDIE